MTEQFSRREFMKRAAAGAVAGASLVGMPYIIAAPRTGKLRTAVIGCGGQGTGAHVPAAAREHLVALIDADENKLAKAIKKAKDTNAELDTATVKTYNDYRKFFDEMHKEVDAIFIATPNHHHALPALLAMQHGIGVYVEKPMSFNIHEARTMAEYARKYKVATQMGIQGHSGEGYRRLCEYIWAGAIGNVTEVHCWSDCLNGGVGGRPPTLPVPAGLNWDSWIGPAPFRDYHKDLHPHEWHGWYDFGNGALGNRGCHIMDGAFWALKLDKPSSLELEEVNGGSEERYPMGARIRWDYPARGDMPPLKLYWYDGKRKGVQNAGPGDTADSVAREAANVPPLMLELKKKYDRKFEGNATLYVGDKGVMYTGFYGGGTRIIPEEAHKAFPVPEPKIPRIKGSHQEDFLRGVRDPSHQPCANFDYSARQTEMVLLGDLAMKAGIGKKVEWDGDKCTNMPELNAMLQRDYRKGWEY
ncbi:MAG: Gfo/Idh/MocA family oxidoreductase [Armatimonadota bacterium]|nr:Gfo/Idh/MocA family oxidoreductase [Armatimonadota bacterium]